MDKPLTIVLTMFNQEQHLQTSVLEVLEIADSHTQRFSLVIVDDGSTDETYETACEMSRTYPQITVLRHSSRQGLRRALELVGNHIAAEMVVVHDGVSGIDVEQLKALLESNTSDESRRSAGIVHDVALLDTSASRRFSSLKALHNSMEQAHRSLTGFCWMKLEKRLIPRRCPDTTQVVNHHGAPNVVPSSSTGMMHPAPLG